MMESDPPLLKLIKRLPVLPLFGRILEECACGDAWLSSITDVCFFKQGESAGFI